MAGVQSCLVDWKAQKVAPLIIASNFLVSILVLLSSSLLQDMLARCCKNGSLSLLIKITFGWITTTVVRKLFPDCMQCSVFCWYLHLPNHSAVWPSNKLVWKVQMPSELKHLYSSDCKDRATTLSPAGPHDNNKDQFDFCSKMKKWVLFMPWTSSTDWEGEKYYLTVCQTR